MATDKEITKVGEGGFKGTLVPLEELRKELENLKQSVSMLYSLTNSNQVWLQTLQEKMKSREANAMASNREPKEYKWEDVLYYLKEPNNLNPTSLTLEHFITECQGAVRSLTLQSTDEDLTDVFIKVAKTEYELLDKKMRPFFTYRLTKRGEKKLVFKNQYRKWQQETTSGDIVTGIYQLEFQFRISQMNQLDIEDSEKMSSDEQDLYIEYSRWLTSSINKSKILKSILEFADEIELF